MQNMKHLGVNPKMSPAGAIRVINYLQDIHVAKYTLCDMKCRTQIVLHCCRLCQDFLPAAPCMCVFFINFPAPPPILAKMPDIAHFHILPIACHQAYERSYFVHFRVAAKKLWE